MRKDLKHGSRMLERLLRENALDGRTKTAQEYHALQDALAADRGGYEHCTTAEKILIERAAALTLICRCIEAWSFKTGVLDRAGTLSPPLAKSYTSHTSALQRTLGTLGMRPDKVERLRDAAVIVGEHETSDSVPEADSEGAVP